MGLLFDTGFNSALMNELKDLWYKEIPALPVVYSVILVPFYLYPERAGIGDKLFVAFISEVLKPLGM